MPFIQIFRHNFGLLIFCICALVAVQLDWALVHNRTDEMLTRALGAALVGLVLGGIVLALVYFLGTDKFKLTVRDFSKALWPSFLLLIAPFHVATRCENFEDCSYNADIFIYLFIAAVLTIFLSQRRASVSSSSSEALSPSESVGKPVHGIMRMLSNQKFLLAFVLAFIVLLIRGWGRFSYPEFFAEGGKVFLAEALSDGWASLLFTYDGFTHLIPRLIVLFGLDFLPVKDLVSFSVTMCFLTAAAVSANIVRDSYRWIIPSDIFRWSICVLLCLAPGLFEMLGNLPNMHYFLFFFLGVLLLKDPKVEFSPLELILCLAIVLTTGLAVTLLPLMIFRVINANQQRLVKGAGISNLAFGKECLMLAIILIPVLWSAADMAFNPANTGIKAGMSNFDIGNLLDGYVNIFIIYFFLFPFSGSVTVSKLLQSVSPYLLLLPFFIIFLSLFYRRWQENKTSTIFTFLWIASIVGVPTMIFLFRPHGFVFFLIDQNWGNFAWWMRYNYLVAAPCLLLWFLLLKPSYKFDALKKSSMVSLVIVVSVVFHAQYIFEIPRYSEETFWEDAVVNLEPSLNTGCPREAWVRIYPTDPWGFLYTNPNTEEGDCK